MREDHLSPRNPLYQLLNTNTPKKAFGDYLYVNNYPLTKRIIRIRVIEILKPRHIIEMTKRKPQPEACFPTNVGIRERTLVNAIQRIDLANTAL
jgi:hypothetical protein